VHATGSCTSDGDSTNEPKVSGTVMRTTYLAGPCHVAFRVIMHDFLYLCACAEK
jgi:hypothetical protein